MKKKNKDFDCVEMKIKIQEELNKEMEGLSFHEKIEFLKNIPSDSILDKLLKKKKLNTSQNYCHVAEEYSKYK
jgi:hypothetical protein